MLNLSGLCTSIPIRTKSMSAAQNLSWTTADELASVRKLFEAGRLDLLKKYLENARSRRWVGEGMRVEPGVVILQTEDWIAELISRSGDREKRGRSTSA